MKTAKLFAFDGRSKCSGASGALEIEMNTSNLPDLIPLLPDSSQSRPDPIYIRSLIETANLSQNGVARALGINPRTLRAYVSGEADIPYSAQYCIEVLARGGVSDNPVAPPVWFKTALRPLRKADKGRFIIARSAGAFIFGRVAVDGYGVKIDALPSNGGVGGHEVSANALSDYVLVDGPEAA